MFMRFIMIWMYIIPFFFISCGISDIPFFFGASVDNPIPGDNIVRITHNTANKGKSFLGYDIYYKLYLRSDIRTIKSDRDYITDTTRQPTPSALTTKKFRLFKTASKEEGGGEVEIFREYPMIRPTNKNSAQNFYVDFTANPNSSGSYYSFNEQDYIAGGTEEGYQALLVINGKAIILRRNLGKNDNDENKSFFNTKNGSSYEKSDDDIKKMIDSEYTRGDDLSVVIAVIPYGIDISNVSRVYGNIAMSKEMPLEYTNTPR